MQTSRSSNRKLSQWLAVTFANALQWLLEGISSRAEAITGSPPSEGLAIQRSSNQSKK
ncbi:hypothetical protein KK137_07395 [Croceibacterium sp. LX-88]|jgi:hypothetical protein|uniref:Transposase n=1 Tax=Croceibacterium selenioxidans TaxID=2838833 RepID=A0ABS5W317_9SPHN|nr:hypothetical protein [Croceibacterium selenioxidans]MBT2134153.1 hypothetical protein [Croceibacterium selenioxidans]